LKAVVVAWWWLFDEEVAVKLRSWMMFVGVVGFVDERK